MGSKQRLEEATWEVGDREEIQESRWGVLVIAHFPCPEIDPSKMRGMSVIMTLTCE